MRILLVEDEPVLAQQINTVLVTEGYAVDTADDGITAEVLGLSQVVTAVENVAATTPRRLRAWWGIRCSCARWATPCAGCPAV